MAIVSVTEIGNSELSEIDEGLRRQYTREFLVVSNLADESSFVVRLATGIPRPFDPHPLDLSAIVRRVRATRRPDIYSWVVSVEYSTVIRDAEGNPTDPAFQNENPLNRPADIEWFSIKRQVAQTEDRDGDKYVNSANDPFDPPIELPESKLAMRLSRNTAGFDPTTIEEFEGSLNDDIFLGFGAASCYMDSIAATRQFENNFVFWRETYEIHFDNDGWGLEILDQGFNTLNAGTKTPIRNDDGTPISTPALLDGNGAKLSDTADPVYILRQPYQLKDWSLLNLV